VSAPIRHIAVSQRPVFLVNSRLGLLYATPPNLLLNQGWPHFSRSYVCILPSSLTRVLSSALDFSSRLPVSVYGTVLTSLTLGIISWHRDYARFSFLSVRSLSHLVSGCGFAYTPHQLSALTGTTVLRPGFASCVIPSKLAKVREYEPVSHRLRLSSSP
jgi:hypothetical protein